MTVVVNILEEGKGIEIIVKGVVKGDDILEAYKTKYDPAYVEKHRYHIIDNSACTEYAVSHQHISEMADIDRQMASINPNIMMAVIESSTLQYSLYSLWKMQVQESVYKAKSFSSRLSAYAWLESELILASDFIHPNC